MNADEAKFREKPLTQMNADERGYFVTMEAAFQAFADGQECHGPSAFICVHLRQKGFWLLQ
jgi:hypothetical protein